MATSAMKPQLAAEIAGNERRWIARGLDRRSPLAFAGWMAPWLILLGAGVYATYLCLRYGLGATNLGIRFGFGLWIFLDLAGRIEHRHCETHPKLANVTAAEFDFSTYGLDYPMDRFYHRGQTWVKRESDGTLTIGLTDLGKRLLGHPGRVVLPRVYANGRGWTAARGGVEVRILAPVDGEVVAAGGPDGEFYPRVKPLENSPDLARLLRGQEVSGWVRAQLEQLQILVTPAGSTASLAGGGTLMEDLPKAQPEADWDRVYGQMFMEPWTGSGHYPCNRISPSLSTKPARTNSAKASARSVYT